MDYLNALEEAWGMDDTSEKVKLLEQAIASAICITMSKALLKPGNY